MAIPKYNELYPNVLKVLSDGKEYSTRKMDDIIIPTLGLTNEELEERLSSGGRVIKNRLGWARTYIKKAELIESRKRGYVNITEEGLKAFKQNPNITENDLMKYPSFIYFISGGEQVEPVFPPENEPVEDLFSNIKRNVIYFGAPGTGKSYNLNNDKDELTDDFERVTFHPDYSYANFVGTYKPISNEDGISYEYVPGPFMRVLVKALKNPNKAILLIIEEINRANTAAVFGEIFQLLDRDENNESTFPIETSEDIKTFLKKELNEDFDKIKIPSNMFIWATMNSADQGVFPMDTAFKRRWTFKRVPNTFDDSHPFKNELIFWTNITWQNFVETINWEISKLSAYWINWDDKQIWKFFVSFDDIKDKEKFAEKVLLYLWEDVVKFNKTLLFKEEYDSIDKLINWFKQSWFSVFKDWIFTPSWNDLN